jgi:uncharacterized protein
MLKDEDKKNITRGQFTVKVAKLRDGPVVIEKEIPIAMLSKRLSYCEYEAVPKNALAKIKIESCGSGVLVKGNIESNIHSNCGMCLANIALNLASPVSTYLFPKGETVEDFDKEFTPDDLNREYFEGETISLNDLILDAIMLDMPMNPKCGETCPGLPGETSFQSELELDPRLAPLAALSAKKEN